MRVLLALLVSLTLFSANAQTTHLPVPQIWGYSSWSPFTPFYQPIPINTSKPGWQLTPFAGISAGYIFSNGGTSYLSAPMGLILSHPLTKNITGFGGITATPTIFGNMSYPTLSTEGFPVNGQPYNFRMNPAITGGLMYTNDAKTFSISGRVSVDRGSYPVYVAPNSYRK